MSQKTAYTYNILSGDKFVNRPEKLSPLKSEIPEKEQQIRGIHSNESSLASFMSDVLEKDLDAHTSNYSKIIDRSPANLFINTRLIPSSAKPKTEFNYMLIRINNYIKICEYGHEGHIDIIKRLNNFIYNNETFDIEFIELPGLKYNLLGAGLGITDANSFISNENIEVIQTDDLAKHLRNMAEALNFLKGDTGDDSGVPAIIKDGLAKRLRPTELREYPDLTNCEVDIAFADKSKKTEYFENLGKNKPKSKKTDPETKVINLDAYKEQSDPEPINDGLDAFYSVSDFGRTDFMHGLSGQSPLLNSKLGSGLGAAGSINNLAADGNILNTYVVLYNSQFFNTMVIEKHLYESIIIDSDTSSLSYIPEIESVREIVLSNEFSLNECRALLSKQIYYTKSDINKDLDYFMNKSTGDYPSLENIRQYIQQAYELDNNCENRIQFKNLCDDIFLNLNVAKKFHECVKRSLPMIFSGLGLEKKRYSEGVFWFGIKRRANTIYKAREDGTSLTRKLTPEETQRLMDIEINSRANIDKAGSAMFEKQRILGYLPKPRERLDMTTQEIKNYQDKRKFGFEPEPSQHPLVNVYKYTGNDAI